MNGQRDSAPFGSDELRIAGLNTFSTVDWPDKITATVFLQGCPWDCFYCHNPALIDTRAPGSHTWSEVTELLDRRGDLLDGVVFSGGEPTLQRALPTAMREVREYGLGVGLHTAGAYPGLLVRALRYVDWVGLDIKAHPADYAEVTGKGPSGDKAWNSLELALAEQRERAGSERPLDIEVRTTVHASAIDDETLYALGDRLADAGVTTWAVQRFRSVGVRSPLPRIADSGTDTETNADTKLTLDRLPAERFASLTVR